MQHRRRRYFPAEGAHGATPSGLLLARALRCAWRAVPPTIDLALPELEQLEPLLLTSGAAALVWWRIRDSHLSTTAFGEKLRSSYRQNALVGAVREHEIARTFQALRGAGIEPILFKGWATARLYPTPALRPPGDIDLMVPPGDEARAQSLLRQLEGAGGDVDTWHEEWDRLTDREWMVLYEHSRTIEIEGTDIRVLGREHDLALLCVHFLRHGAWRPVWLCDIAVALESRPADFDWDLCLRGQRWDGDWIACALGAAHRLLRADVSDTPVAWRAEHLPTWLLPEIVRQWEKPSHRQHDPPDAFQSALRRPAMLAEALGTRWPNPIQATIRVGGSFNEIPRFPYQLTDYLAHAVRFLGRTFTAMRRTGPRGLESAANQWKRK